jgi:hypothetical protein
MSVRHSRISFTAHDIIDLLFMAALLSPDSGTESHGVLLRLLWYQTDDPSSAAHSTTPAGIFLPCCRRGKAGQVITFLATPLSRQETGSLSQPMNGFTPPVIAMMLTIRADPSREPEHFTLSGLA